MKGEFMKKHKRLLFVGIATCSLLLVSCGDGLHVLTPEEENLDYATYPIAKHNIQKKDDMTSVVVSETDDESDDVTNSENTQDEQNPGGSEVVQDTGITLAEAIGHGTDLTVTYTGAYVADDYVESDLYTADAKQGKKFYIMKFTISNTTQNDIMVDNLTKGFRFKLTSGEISINGELTLLMTDFSSYVGTIGAGQAVETVLLFEVPEGSVDSIVEPTLEILIDNTLKTVMF